MPTRERKPNRLLAWERLQRGWSHEELARQIIAEMERRGDKDTGLNRNTVRRWETGERRTDPRYRKYLVAVFGKPADQLGLLDPEELAMRPDPEADSIRRFLAMVESWKAGMDRQTFLRELLVLGAGPLVLPVADMSNEVLGRFQRAADSSTLAEATVQDFEQITARHRGLYWQVPAPEFSQSVAAHARLGLRLLRLFGPDGLRQRLARAAGETAMMAGRLAFFDLHQPSEAEKWYQLGLEASREAGDHALAAAVLAHAAFVPAYRGDAAKARDLIRAARAHATHHTSPLTRAWLYAVEAEITAKLGEAHTSLDRIARAEGTLGQSSQHEDPAWLDFFDAGRLDGFAGFCYLAAQHTDDARRALHASLDTLGENAVKQRVVVLADIATSHVLDQEVEHACATLHQALDHLDVSWYAIGAARIREVREQLDPWDSVTAIRELDDRIYSWGNTMRVFTG